MPFALLYRSVCVFPFGDLGIRALTVRAAQRNAAAGITGVLLHGEHSRVEGAPGAFVQWIEGPEGAVRDLFARIRADGRHTEINVLASGATADLAGGADRLFPDWTMRAEPMSSLPATLGGFLASARAHRGAWAQSA